MLWLLSLANHFLRLQQMNSQINALHSKAMDIAEKAFVAKRKGKLKETKKLSVEAFEYERDAALLLLDNFEIEPTRSLLFRSAACLAFDAENYSQARQMADYALQGNPPAEIKEELNDLLAEIEALDTRTLTLKLDADVFDWMKQQGMENYQVRINQLLRSYIQTH